MYVWCVSTHSSSWIAHGRPNAELTFRSIHASTLKKIDIMFSHHSAEKTHQNALFHSSSSTDIGSIVLRLRCAPTSCANLTPTPTTAQHAWGADEPCKNSTESYENHKLNTTFASNHPNRVELQVIQLRWRQETFLDHLNLIKPFPAWWMSTLLSIQ